jgi:hypothetical protein
MKNLKIYILVVFLLGLATPALAYVMSSTSYRIERDSINFAGGLGTSTSYKTESTLGEAGTGLATSTSFSLKAGYQQMDSTWVTLTVPASGTLLPAIDKNTGGIASTSVAFTVITNNSTGYTLRLRADSAPALSASGGSFVDYVNVGADPDFTWSVAATSSAFGFTPEGTDISSRYKDLGGVCNQAGGTDTANSCWDGLSTSYQTIASTAAANNPTGIVTTVKLRAEAGSASSQPIGAYSATVSVTAYSN